MYTSFLADPTWERLGFSTPPDETRAGEGIGVVITDTVINHPTIKHLAGRLKRVTVNDDMSVACRDVVLEEQQEEVPYPNIAEHGMVSLFLLSHLPFELEGKKYVGLVPQATFIMVDHHDPFRLKKAMEWIIERQEIWNVQIVINFLVVGGDLSIRPTCEEPIVQAMMPAIEAGLLVIQANGNSPAINNNSPMEFFAVGGYDDGGLKSNSKKIHPLSSKGINGDGHLRPDILAPFTYLPTPYYDCSKTDLYTPYSNHTKTDMKLSYFGGTCGTATLIGGVCAYILSQYPDISLDSLRSALVHLGTPLGETEHTAPTVDVAKTINVIQKGDPIPPLPSNAKENIIGDVGSDIYSKNEIKRGIALTKLIEQKNITREELWNFVDDPSPYVQKVAIWGLHKPINIDERELSWGYFSNSRSDVLGVREAWAYMLLFGANKEELDRWMQFVTDLSADVRHCVNYYLKKYYPDAPGLVHTPDTNTEVIQKIAAPVLQWYMYFSNKGKFN
ncbi:S8 family serine peptidase [Lederbergia citrea]|uniref:S8 family serine peptidase n=1 Tax=Lederbergia citrea TaxID=2833581 RepID=A0A942URS5_9BACI|nr:S8 family serine peptidase [Lederbergia citrea]MBS4221784.1 S8 family serine peptidase [Lederbergia citrea]